MNAPITAKVTFRGRSGEETIETSTGHRISYGGASGDGYCFAHSSFECINKMSILEKFAIQNAGMEDG